MTQETKITKVADNGIVEKIERFYSRFVTLPEKQMTLPIALWIIGTHIFPHFDAFPYLVITADTKRAGKTRSAEVMSFMTANSKQFGAMTAASFFKTMKETQPTIYFDEAEVLSGEAASTMRSVLNMGYRKGSKVPRVIGDKVVEYNTYCPKVFILIGDVFDTLRDRSIVLRLRRGEPGERFMFTTAEAEGSMLREEIHTVTTEFESALIEAYCSIRGLEFLTDRDEEIWIPLFALANVLCPNRVEELKRIAVDIATEKTADKRRYTVLADEEEKAQADEYRLRLLKDLLQVINGNKGLYTEVAIDKLKAMPVAPWRKFKGTGLTPHMMSDMLSPFGVKPKLIRDGKKVSRGYTKADVEKAIRNL